MLLFLHHEVCVSSLLTSVVFLSHVHVIYAQCVSCVCVLSLVFLFVLYVVSACVLCVCVSFVFVCCVMSLFIHKNKNQAINTKTKQ